MATNTVTLSQLRIYIRNRVEMDSSTYVSDNMINHWVNDANSELYDAIVDTNEDYALSTNDITTVADTKEYNLPSDMYRLRAVSRIEGDYEYDIPRYSLRQRGRRTEGLVGVSGAAERFRYRLQNGKIAFTPEPGAGLTIRVYYTPSVPFMQFDADTFEHWVQPGWQEFVEVRCAQKCLERDMLDATEYARQSEMLKARILKMAGTYDSNYGQQIHDVTVPDWDYGNLL